MLLYNTIPYHNINIFWQTCCFFNEIIFIFVRSYHKITALKKYLLISILFITTIISCGQNSGANDTAGASSNIENNSKETVFNPFEKLKEYQKLIKQKHLNIQYVFVVDYAEHSGKKRMCVIDILKKKVVRKMMVAHGAKSETKMGYATDFSNVSESNKSSLGYAIVNTRAYSQWGIHVKYWLDGISKTNSNMRKRIMVLHSYQMVPSFETYPLPIVTSLGCVMVSEDDMTYLDKLIKKQHNKRLLMDILG